MPVIRTLLVLVLGVAVGACAPPPMPMSPTAPTQPAAPPVARSSKVAKYTGFKTLAPSPDRPPEMIGKLQRHWVQPGENLLTISRDAGIGFRALRDANPAIDEWEPKPGVELLVPSRWILPRSSSRGLIINIPEMRLYMFPPDTEPGEEVGILTWAVGIGAEHAPSPIGPFLVKSKDEKPTWVVPDSIYAKMEDPRRVVPPGPDNPLGDYRIRLDVDVYAIHGTNDPWTVGRLTTHGCVRLYPEDIEYLYGLVDRGTPGEFVYQPVKVGEKDGRIYVEVHQDVYQMIPDLEGHTLAEVSRAGVSNRVDMNRVRTVARLQTGIPMDVMPDAKWKEEDLMRPARRS
jgi:L,D-transpeptidase ErfK/SrfK